MAWLELFERFQVAIAALVGFSGIAATIRANAWLDKKERKDQRSQEKDPLIATLYSELTTIRVIIDGNLVKLDQVEDIFLHPLHNKDALLVWASSGSFSSKL